MSKTTKTTAPIAAADKFRIKISIPGVSSVPIAITVDRNAVSPTLDEAIEVVRKQNENLEISMSGLKLFLNGAKAKGSDPIPMPKNEKMAVISALKGNTSSGINNQ